MACRAMAKISRGSVAPCEMEATASSRVDGNDATEWDDARTRTEEPEGNLHRRLGLLSERIHKDGFGPCHERNLGSRPRTRPVSWRLRLEWAGSLWRAVLRGSAGRELCHELVTERASNRKRDPTYRRVYSRSIQSSASRVPRV